MYLIEPKTEQAKEWINDNVYSEPWQWLGQNLAVDHHFIDDLVQGMLESGLTDEDFAVMYA